MVRTKATSSRLSDGEAEEAINRSMLESGERDRLRHKLARLLEECGWREQVKLQVSVSGRTDKKETVQHTAFTPDKR